MTTIQIRSPPPAPDPPRPPDPDPHPDSTDPPQAYRGPSGYRGYRGHRGTWQARRVAIDTIRFIIRHVQHAWVM